MLAGLSARTSSVPQLLLSLGLHLPVPFQRGLCLLGALGTGGWAVSEWLLEFCRHVFDVGAVESGRILLSWSSTGHQTVEPLCMCPGTCAHRNLVAPNTSLEKVACRKRGQ